MWKESTSRIQGSSENGGLVWRKAERRNQKYSLVGKSKVFFLKKRE